MQLNPAKSGLWELFTYMLLSNHKSPSNVFGASHDVRVESCRDCAFLHAASPNKFHPEFRVGLILDRLCQSVTTLNVTYSTNTEGLRSALASDQSQ